MVSRHTALHRSLEKVHDTMSDCKRRITNRSMLRNLTDLSPVIANATRWSGKYLMLQRFVDLYDTLVEVVEAEGSTVRMDKSAGFLQQVKCFTEMLGEINVVTKELKTRGATLSDCRLAVDMLMDVVKTSRADSGSPFYGCKLGTTYISTDSYISTESSFECAVVKIQRNEASSLSAAELNACKNFKLHKTNTPSSTIRERSTIAEKLAEKKRRRLDDSDKYMNCSFILGSVAEVERLWSIAGNLLANNRKKMSPYYLSLFFF